MSTLRTTLRTTLTAPPYFRVLAVPAALALLALAAVHLIDGPSSTSDQFYVGALELALAAASAPLAVMLLARPVPALWHVAGAMCTAALLVFIASRTVGLPGSTDDIGNWGQALGILSVAVEGAVVALAATALWLAPKSRDVGWQAPSP